MTSISPQPARDPELEAWAKALSRSDYRRLEARQIQLADSGFGRDQPFVMLACWNEAARQLQAELPAPASEEPAAEEPAPRLPRSRRKPVADDLFDLEAP